MYLVSPSKSIGNGLKYMLLTKLEVSHTELMGLQIQSLMLRSKHLKASFPCFEEVDFPSVAIDLPNPKETCKSCRKQEQPAPAWPTIVLQRFS